MPLSIMRDGRREQRHRVTGTEAHDHGFAFGGPAFDPAAELRIAVGVAVLGITPDLHHFDVLPAALAIVNRDVVRHDVDDEMRAIGPR